MKESNVPFNTMDGAAQWLSQYPEAERIVEITILFGASILIGWGFSTIIHLITRKIKSKYESDTNDCD